MTATPDRSDLAPSYDRPAITTGIVHIGVGGFHRAHQAMYVDRLMRDGSAPGGPHETRLDWGICGVGLLPGEGILSDYLGSKELSLTTPTP